MSGLKRIAEAFASCRAQGRAALMPYFTLGYPAPDLSLDILTAIARSGADLLELGIPFSDPLADGPTIQRSTQIALSNGITVARCLEMTAELRRRHLTQPLLLMGYLNPLLAYGVERFITDAATAGADGLIIPDLPPEEAGAVEATCQEYDLALVFLASPNTPAERLAYLAHRSRGFLYLVSLTGVTGARSTLPADLENFVQRARAVAQQPLAVGFGISTPEQASRVGAIADGVIVGSALIQAVERSQSPVEEAAKFVSLLAAGLTSRAGEN